MSAFRLLRPILPGLECSYCRIASLWIEREGDDEFVEPDDWPFALTVFFEEVDPTRSATGTYAPEYRLYVNIPDEELP